MTGFGKVSIALNSPRSSITSRCVIAVRSANSAMSAPAMKALSPAPVKTTTRTDSSARNSSRTAAPSARVWIFRAIDGDDGDASAALNQNSLVALTHFTGSSLFVLEKVNHKDTKSTKESKRGEQTGSNFVRSSLCVLCVFAVRPSWLDRHCAGEDSSGGRAGCSSATQETNKRVQFSAGSAIWTPTRAVP